MGCKWGEKMSNLPEIKIYLGNHQVTKEWTKTEAVKVKAKDFWIQHGETEEVAVIKEIRRTGDSMEQSMKQCGFPTFQDVEVKVEYADGTVTEHRLDNQFDVLEEEHQLKFAMTSFYSLHPVLEEIHNILETFTFKFFSDPAHGWVKVPKELLKQLGISDKISSYSYQRNDFAYLEEDADATLFAKTFEEKTGKKPKFQESHCNGRSKIRNYQPYSSFFGVKIERQLSKLVRKR